MSNPSGKSKVRQDIDAEVDKLNKEYSKPQKSKKVKSKKKKK